MLMNLIQNLLICQNGILWVVFYKLTLLGKLIVGSEFDIC